MNLKGRNILITGGGGDGIASGICEALSHFGARLLINEKSREKLDSVLMRYPDAVPAVADISNFEEIRVMFGQLEKEVGVVHGLVNNAGVGLSKPSHEVNEEEFARLYDVDIKGVWMMSRFFTQQLLKNKSSGNIVNVSSVHAHATMNRYAIYASAKSAVEGLTRGMAVELGRYDIRVNAIGPGYVHAEQNYDLIGTWTDDPQQWVKDYVAHELAIPRAVEAIDCGNTVAFLLSDLSRSITGQTIYVDNGDTVKLVGLSCG